MAEPRKDAQEGSDPPTRADIQEIVGRITTLEQGLFSKLTELLQPLTEKIDHLSLSLQKVASVAEGAMDLSMLQQEDIKSLQEAEEQHADQLAILGNRQRFFNLKFRALDEKVEGATDLTVYMTRWLADVLHLKEDSVPHITQAFRMGPANNATRTLPRDIIVTFADINTKNKILAIAREKGFLLHKMDRVQVFMDLTPETLQKRKELKEITSALNDVNMRYRWATPLKLQIHHKGKTYIIRTEEEGHDILKHLNVPVPMRTEKPSWKRKSSVPNSPDKNFKKHNTDNHC